MNDSSINPYEPTNTYQATTESKLVDGGTPEEQVLATRTQRFFAFLVDTLVILAASLVILLVYFAASYFANGMNFDETSSSIEELFFDSEPLGRLESIFENLVGTLFYIGLFTAINGQLLSTRGQTVGKLLLRIRIVSDSGCPVPLWPLIWKRYFLVELIGAFPGFLALIPFLEVLLIFRRNRKCWHDNLAGTKVIQLPVANQHSGNLMA